MKSSASTFAAALLGTAVALLAYYQFIAKPAQRTVAEAAQTAAKEAAQVELERARIQANQIAKDLDESVQKSVATAQSAFEQQLSDKEKVRLISMAMASFSMGKVSVAESYANQVQYPSTLADLGLSSEAFKNEAIESMQLKTNGVLEAKLSDKLGANTRLVFTPKANDAGVLIWSCKVAGPAELLRLVPECTGE